MLFYNSLFLLIESGKILFLLSFIKQVELAGDIKRPFFARSPKELFLKIINFFLQGFFTGRLLFDDKTEGTDHLCLLRHHRFQL